MQHPHSIGEWLSEQLRNRGASLRQVAEYTGLSPSTIHNTITGKYNPDPATCIKLAEYFRVDPDIPLELAGHRPRHDTDDLPDFNMYISRKFANNPKLQRALIAAYEAMVSVQEERGERVRDLAEEIERTKRIAEERRQRRQREGPETSEGQSEE